MHMSPHTVYTSCALHNMVLIWISQKIIMLVEITCTSLVSLSTKRNLSYNTELTLKNISSTRNLPPCRFPGVDLAAKSKLRKHWSSSGSKGAQVGNLCLHWKWGAQVGHPCRSPKCTHRIKEPLGAASSSGSRD